MKITRTLRHNAINRVTGTKRLVKKTVELLLVDTGDSIIVSTMDGKHVGSITFNTAWDDDDIETEILNGCFVGFEATNGENFTVVPVT